MIDLEFIAKVNLLKEQHPCSTESVDRTPVHNTAIKGAKLSMHLSTIPGGAKAIDLIFDDAASLLPAAIYARALGFTGIEVDYRNLHVHVDLRSTVPWHVVCTQERTYSLEEYLTLPSQPV